MPSDERFERVSVVKKANVFFDGRCVSHTVFTGDGARKSVGVILPSTLTFETAAPEVMEIVAGRCRVQLAGSDETVDYGPGQGFSVPANSGFQHRGARACPLRLPLRLGATPRHIRPSSATHSGAFGGVMRLRFAVPGLLGSRAWRSRRSHSRSWRTSSPATCRRTTGTRRRR